jgi:GT2 family glycosyltransferase
VRHGTLETAMSANRNGIEGIDFAVVFACYNQLDYTRQFIDSLKNTGMDFSRVVAVDNASTDDTRQYLESLNLGGKIFNSRNLGCGVAWNQGALALQAEWTIIMNNDVIVAADWLQNLVCAARDNNLKIVSPALIEGPLDYDFQDFSRAATARMKTVLRAGGRHAVCLAVHSSVWMDIGYFRATPKLWGFEDTLFFHEADQAGIPMGITGSSWLHHFGSITVKAMKEERGLRGKQGLGARRNYRLLNQSWLERKIKKMRLLKQRKNWRDQEVAEFGMSLHGLRKSGTFEWI